MIRILFITCCHVEKFSILTKDIPLDILLPDSLIVISSVSPVCVVKTRLPRSQQILAAAVAGAGKHRHGTVHFGPIHGYE